MVSKTHLNHSQSLYRSYHRDLRTYIANFYKAYGNKQKAIVYQVDDTAQHIEMFLELASIATQDDLDVLKSRAEHIMRTSQITTRCLDLNPVSLRPSNNDSYLFLPEFPTGRNPNASERCKHHSEVARKLKDLLLELPNDMLSMMNTSDTESYRAMMNAVPFELLLVKLQEFSAAFSLCYGEYDALLRDVEEWYHSLTLSKKSSNMREQSVEYETDVSIC